MTSKSLLTPAEVDRIFRYPVGRAERLAKRDKLPCIKLPCGAIRFDEAVIERLLLSLPIDTTAQQEAHAHA